MPGAKGVAAGRPANSKIGAGIAHPAPAVPGRETNRATTMTQAVRPLALIAAFAVVYFVWGSTYLAIRIAVMDVPPGLLAGTRFVAAGLILLAIALARGQRIPTDRRAWRVIALMGVALVVVGNGAVTWAEQWVPSNLAALLISSSAFWMAWFGTFGARGTPLSARTKLGLVTGFVGVALLMLPGLDSESGLLLPMLAILCSSMAWCGPRPDPCDWS